MNADVDEAVDEVTIGDFEIEQLEAKMAELGRVGLELGHDLVVLGLLEAVDVLHIEVGQLAQLAEAISAVESGEVLELDLGESFDSGSIELDLINSAAV